MPRLIDADALARIFRAKSEFAHRQSHCPNCDTGWLTMAELKLSIKDISEITRVLGYIEGLTYAVTDGEVVDGLVRAVERIDAVVNRGNGDG